MIPLLLMLLLLFIHQWGIILLLLKKRKLLILLIKMHLLNLLISPKQQVILVILLGLLKIAGYQVYRKLYHMRLVKLMARTVILPRVQVQLILIPELLDVQVVWILLICFKIMEHLLMSITPSLQDTQVWRVLHSILNFQMYGEISINKRLMFSIQFNHEHQLLRLMLIMLSVQEIISLQ